MIADTENWPAPSNRSMASLGRERWAERLAEVAEAGDDDTAAFGRSLLANPRGRVMLNAVFGNSPYLTQCLLTEPRLLRDLDRLGPDRLADETIAAVADPATEPHDRAQLMDGLRAAKRRIAVTAALADIAGLWPLETVTRQLTRFAEAALGAACRHLLRAAAAKGSLALADDAAPEAGSGLIVLGMGKLGAEELNYSSDIDLIVLYDDQRLPPGGNDNPGGAFVRLTRDLVRIMEERTADGYVFRTDLRLRPDPGATPVALSVTAAESYYSSLAQSWERAAMIKARPVAGDRAAGEAFLASLRPFVWRRSLDFAAIQDIFEIKQQINDRQRASGALAVNGHNLKLGRGGIREIEFFVQTQQLIHGGRNPRLRGRDTLGGLKALSEAGHIGADVADDLTLGYRFLRQAEHRLQMIDDRQTHTLPTSDSGVDALGTFLGFEVPDMFRRGLRRVLERVDQHYGDLFREHRRGAEPIVPLAFAGTDEDPETAALLAELGFADPPQVFATVRGWLHGRYRATRSERARRLVTRLAPTLVHTLSLTPSPDQTLRRFDDFLGRLPAGVQIFSLFQANPDLIDLLVEILGLSERLGQHLAQNPALLDAVLTPGFFDRLPEAGDLARELADQLAGVRDLEDVLVGVRRWTNDHRFRAGVQVLRRIASPADCAPFLSDLAEVGLRALQEAVGRGFAERHGGFVERHGDSAGAPRLAVIALGKLGGREMTIRSDLDLIAVFDVADPSAESDGPRPLDPSSYHARLWKRIISAVTVPTRDGALYEVDMRLRPSGNAGPLVTSLEAFARYHADSAWTWEHMALTRARVIAGPADLVARLEAAVQGALTRPRDPARLVADVADMRERIAREHPPRSAWDAKYRRGGLVDIEFLAQYLQLRHAPARPEILSANTGQALARLADAGFLDADTAVDLMETLAMWQAIQGYVRLTVEGVFQPAEVSPAVSTALARLVLRRTEGPADFALAERAVEAMAERAYGHFRRLIETPAQAA